MEIIDKNMKVDYIMSALKLSIALSLFIVQVHSQTYQSLPTSLVNTYYVFTLGGID